MPLVEEAQWNLWVLETGEQHGNGQMGQLFAWGQHVEEYFCFDVERGLCDGDAVGGRGILRHLLGACSLLR